MDFTTTTNERLARIEHALSGTTNYGEMAVLHAVREEMDKRGVTEIEEIQIDLMGDLSWKVHYADYTIATFRDGFEDEARAFAASLDAADVHQKLKHRWE